jgi:hypothetical protein
MKEKIFFVFALVFIFAVIATPLNAGTAYVIGNKKVPVIGGDIKATYTGAEKCKTCHIDKYKEWKTSGHPYKIMTSEEAKALRSDFPVPNGYSWDDIQYVIGGWGWKSRFIDKNGYIITKTGPNHEKKGSNQFNWETKTWSDYHPGEVKKYNCQKCHTTGAAYEEGTHQDGLPGIEGTWVFRGVQCEACHGPGSVHVAKGGGRGVAIVVNESAAFCGLCHVRGEPNKIPAKGGFIRHHEQYNELLASPMNNFKCITCHDPHKGVHRGATNPLGPKNGIIKECAECHQNALKEFKGSTMQKAGVKCTDCHMPAATKSAVKLSTYQADVRSHLFKINTRADTDMFTADDKYAEGYLTLEFACLGCHTDKDKNWSLKYAERIHSYVAAPSTAAPTPAPAEPPKGVCGPIALLLLAVLPPLYFRRLAP